ncbi:MAG TPA: 4-phosphoerythronate dehydrogenase PdxB [Bacteroidales bacterium]|nr:4-phosphoerythronate dehydrogenase PdxB [Bacteroidales bacterium]
MLKIVSDNKIPFLRGALESFAKVEYYPGAQIQRHHLYDADALIVRTRTRCDAQLLQGTKVRFIASATIGHDHIDKEFCTQNGIVWANAPGCNANSVVQYMSSALATILLRTGKKFCDITFGIVGVGNVGNRLLNLCKLLGIKTLINDPPRERIEGSNGFSSLQEVMAGADIISLHVPLNPDGPDKTFHLANSEMFSKMRKGAWLINTSRGEVVDTIALKNALQAGIMRGAIIDVWEHEPNIDLQLLQMVCIATPHIAGYSADGKANGTAMSVQAISRFFGLGINSWRPSTIPPAPEGILIPKNCLTLENLFTQLSLASYNIETDHSALLANPEMFEKLREDYPIRREAPAHQVNTQNLTEEMKILTRNLGYNACEDDRFV